MTATDKPTKTRNVNSPLRPAVAVDRIHSLLADQKDRLAAAQREVFDADHAKVMAIAARVPEKDRATFAKLLAAIGVEMPSDDEDGEVIDADQDEDPAVQARVERHLTEPSDIPERLREPLSEARLAVGKKR